MTKRNYGISTSGGNVIATNMAVGDGATINISGDMRVNIARELDAIRDLLESTDLPAEQKIEMTAAVDELASETVADKADETKVSAENRGWASRFWREVSTTRGSFGRFLVLAECFFSRVSGRF